MNNGVYGLTTGQASPTTEKGQVTKSTPAGVIEMPVNPVALGLVSGASYVSRGFSGDPNHMSDLIANAITHKGFALVDIFSPCVTYNKRNTYDWFRQRVYKLEETDHNPSNLDSAIRKAHEWGPKIPLGVFYRTERPTYEDEEPALKFGPPSKQKFPSGDELKGVWEQFF
jgi:2-oxoglutarate ferredoxin oxidoreductase subunit beta